MENKNPPVLPISSKTLTLQQIASVKCLFGLARLAWPETWLRSIDAESLPLAMKLWGQYMTDIEPAMIEEIMIEAAAMHNWPFSIAQFLDMVDEKRGLPSVDVIMRDAIRQDFHHPLIQQVYDEVGSFTFRNASEKDLIKKITDVRHKIIKAERLGFSQKGIDDDSRSRARDQSRRVGMQKVEGITIPRS